MKRGEIWLINLDPTVGAEIQKTRPAIIVSADQLGKLPLSIIVPVTDWKRPYSTAPWMIELAPTTHNGLLKKSAADCFQVRSISHQRFIKKIGYITKSQLDNISQGLASVLQIK